MLKMVYSKFDLLIVILCTWGITDLWFSIYQAMWENNKVDVVVTGVIFVSMLVTWAMDYMERNTEHSSIG